MPKKKPFSGAQKKAQLKAKREKARRGGVGDDNTKARPHFKDAWDFGAQTAEPASAAEPATVVFTKGCGSSAKDSAAGPSAPLSRIGKAPMLGGGQSSLGMSNSNGYKLRTVLTVDSKEVIEARRRDATRPLCYVHGPARLVSPVGLDQSKAIEMPKRPKWDPSWSAQKLEQREEQAFQTWLDSIYSSFGAERLNSFEHNLEVWRQLWRTVEKADILVMLADARAPLLHFSESLFRHIVQDHCKPAVLILNKVDLVPTSVIAMWEEYFRETYPELKVVSLAACPAGVPISIGVAGAGVGLEGKAGGRHPRAHTFGETVSTQTKDKDKEAASKLLAMKKKELMRLKKCGVRNLRTEARELGLSEDLLTAAIEGNSPKEDLIKLVLKNTKWPELGQLLEPEPEPELEPEPEPEPEQPSAVSGKERNGRPQSSGEGASCGGTSRETGGDGVSTAQHVWEMLGECLVRPRPIERPSGEAASAHLPEDAIKAAPFLAGLGEGSIGGAPLCVSIGVVGEPNLGKSSLINALFGSRVVSRSSTPGHTKHLQSLYLNRTTAVIDCPGVIFPRCDVPPGLQVLLGSIPYVKSRIFQLRFDSRSLPSFRLAHLCGIAFLIALCCRCSHLLIASRIAQLREPYSALRFWAERSVPRLHTAYNLQAYSEECGLDPAAVAEQDAISSEGGREWTNGVEPAREGGWTPWALAEAMSLRKKFFSRGGRPDLHRAANFMLREAMEGQKLPLFFEPPRAEEASLNALGAADEKELRELRERQASRAATAAVTQPEHPMTPRTAAPPMSAAERLAKEAQERREQMEEMERYDREMMEEEARHRGA